jgi:hypothetical protein
LGEFTALRIRHLNAPAAESDQRTAPALWHRVYTDSVQGMRRVVARKQEKELALAVVKQRPIQGITIAI